MYSHRLWFGMMLTDLEGPNVLAFSIANRPSFFFDYHKSFASSTHTSPEQQRTSFFGTVSK